MYDQPIAKTTLYCVDGHEFDDEDSDLVGDGTFGPFMVFDVEAQNYRPRKYRTRAAAQVECDKLNRKRHP